MCERGGMRVRRHRPSLGKTPGLMAIGVLTVAAFAVAGCGSDDDTAGPDDDTGAATADTGADEAPEGDEVVPDDASGEDEIVPDDAGSTDGDVFITEGTGAVFLSFPGGRMETFPVECSFYRDRFEVTGEWRGEAEEDGYAPEIYFREEGGEPAQQFLSFRDPELGGLNSQGPFLETSVNGTDVAATIVATAGADGETVEIGFNASCVEL